MAEVWVAEWCDCVYESGFSILSVHATAIGAYRAMRKKLLPEWDEDRDLRLRFGAFRRGDKTLGSKSWRIKKYEVQK